MGKLKNLTTFLVLILFCTHKDTFSQKSNIKKWSKRIAISAIMVAGATSLFWWRSKICRVLVAIVPAPNPSVPALKEDNKSSSTKSLDQVPDDARVKKLAEVTDQNSITQGRSRLKNFHNNQEKQKKSLQKELDTAASVDDSPEDLSRLVDNMGAGIANLWNMTPPSNE